MNVLEINTPAKPVIPDDAWWPLGQMLLVHAPWDPPGHAAPAIFCATGKGYNIICLEDGERYFNTLNTEIKIGDNGMPVFYCTVEHGFTFKKVNIQLEVKDE
jgi:hypothetical protein